MFKDLVPFPERNEAGLPPGWVLARVASVAELLVSNVDKLVSDDEVSVRLCNYVDVYRNDYITGGLGFMPATATPAEIRDFSVRRGDVPITKDSESWTDIGVPAYVPHDVANLVYGYHLATLRPHSDVLVGEYLFRSLQVPSVAAQLHFAATGVTRYGLSQGAIRALVVPVPPVDDQAAIVKYLAHAHRRIDRAIAAKRKLIALLEEQKQAIINQAVTRGLDPCVALKDTNIPWVGEIPAHWDLVPARHLFRPVTRPVLQPELPQLSLTRSSGLVRSGAVGSSTMAAEGAGNLQECENGDFVLNKYRAHKGLFRWCREPGLVTKNYTVLAPTKRVDRDYFEFLFLDPVFAEGLRINARGVGDGMSPLYTSTLMSMKMPAPPLVEQRVIVAQIAAETASADAAIHRARLEIELLREFRTRLASDVVTGQVDVRRIAAALPDLDPDDVTADVSGTEDDLGDEAAEFLEDVDA